MKVLLTGGGSGGHITPVLAVGRELKQLRPNIELLYVIGTGDKLERLPAEDPNISRVLNVRAGKFRRYHGEGLRQLLDVVTLLKNIRDFFYVCIGFIQSLYMLHIEKPDIVFIKGGFVGVPVGLAAALLRIPYITHDSDSIPGLANRIIARWARLHAVAMPVDNYPYDPDKTRRVGVPINSQYKFVNRTAQKKFIEKIGLPELAEVLLITGGGNGAAGLNVSITKISRALLGRHSQLHIVHIAGPGHVADITERYDVELRGRTADTNRVHVLEFVDMLTYAGAADVIISRAGANSLAEFAALGKACIIVPNPLLTGGHQLKNAQILAEAGAIVELSAAQVKKNSELLLKEIEQLLDEPTLRAKLAVALHKFADTNASTKLAKLILEAATTPEKGRQ